ncbi:T-lymphocyte activation antigen CD80 isoform X1 [Sphaeramia orbicularis]|uniref:T-lymphocyte activation antigen CD80 isoform X1 n=1 Tax=Sphaeramia orbicularis TaxID=375764 RepID=UPI00117D5573|nr:T-lymphocyte activation antigen CD80-like isoform X1 [Sphaeramia orbicularis]XP_029993209.1 T-lymphocyte activation antigen CD80-like isoform X1 [Sphaeramia orbicularis]
MSMAFPVALCVIVLSLYFSAGNAKTFVSVECEAKKVGQLGKHTMLQCLVHYTVEDVHIMIVTWKKEEVDKPVLAYNPMDGTTPDTAKEPGYQFAVESWNSSNTNVSLLITDTELAHAGRYTCTVITDSGISTGSTNLKVTAKYNTPTIQRTGSAGENGIECRSDGGYPQGQLRWFVDKMPWQQVIETDVKKSQSGTYNLSSKLILLKGSTISKYTCVVFNASGEKENEATFEILDTDVQSQGSEPKQSHAAVVAPLVVIGSLIVGLLLVLFLRRRSRQARRPSATPLMHEPQVCRCEYDAEQGADQEMVAKCEEKERLSE